MGSGCVGHHGLTIQYGPCTVTRAFTEAAGRGGITQAEKVALKSSSLMACFNDGHRLSPPSEVLIVSCTVIRAGGHEGTPAKAFRLRSPQAPKQRTETCYGSKKGKGLGKFCFKT